jgi:hypothetical protein
MTSLFFVLVQAREQGSDAQKTCPVRILKLFKSSLERAECGLRSYLKKVLDNFGAEYVINFA